MRASAGGKALTSLLALAGLVSPAFAGKVDFNREVLPILTNNCFACHGPDAAKREADLRLDVRPSAGQSGLATVVAGKPAESELIARVTAKDDEGRMPPPKAGPALK